MTAGGCNMPLLCKLAIAVLPASPRLWQNETADEGELYIVECAVSGGKPVAEYRWQLTGQLT